MSRRPPPGWLMYREQMDHLGYGDALWEPAPTPDYTRIKIGDVGFIRRGQFHLMFSAGSPLGLRQPGVDVPITFEQLDVGTLVPSEPRPSGCLRTPTVRPIGADLVDTEFTPLSSEHGTNFTFELTEDRGAALVTRYPTYREDCLLEAAFETYTKRYYESWVTFARQKQYGNDVQPVLVSGVDMTRDFAMVAYSNEGASLGSDSTTTVPMFASASAPFRGTWRTKCSPRTNHGPQQRTPPSREQTILRSRLRGTGSATNEFNQCVFVRYYTMCSRKRWAIFSKTVLMRAGAGPHDLGSGDNRGDAYPELTVQHGSEPTTSSDVVVRSTPYEEESESWYAIADYVFQNSNATSVLMHHRDLAEIRLIADLDDISSILAMKRPRIVVEGDGVARIVCGENRQLTQPDSPIVPPDPLQLRDLDRALPQFHKVTSLEVHPHTRIRPSIPAQLVTFLNTPGSVSDTQRQLEKFDPSNKEYQQLLHQLLGHKDLELHVQGLEGSSLRGFVELLDKALNHVPATDDLFQKALGRLQNICGNREMLPWSCLIPNERISNRGDVFATGAFSSTRRAGVDGKSVCIKALRLDTDDIAKKVRSFFVRSWKPSLKPLGW
ncbi:hypothetical protein BDM02DRAFT_3174168 [Thelephora ganbajun]|uniref:Uncharacterized protein n=1 Tax=Thelephora ganbajun TaxID=370292 RepID=A0ACB6Z6F1_THEGA|nr:hypothetical protein BDM02DRAFT_3174168 [Thelephora ganbajun]